MPDQQRGKVERRNRDALRHDLGHEHRAIGNDEGAAIVQLDHQIASAHGDIVQRRPFGQGHCVVGVGDQDHAACAGAGCRGEIGTRPAQGNFAHRNLGCGLACAFVVHSRRFTFNAANR